jgi:hypothetical protein
MERHRPELLHGISNLGHPDELRAGGAEGQFNIFGTTPHPVQSGGFFFSGCRIGTINCGLYSAVINGNGGLVAGSVLKLAAIAPSGTQEDLIAKVHPSTGTTILFRGNGRLSSGNRRPRVAGSTSSARFRTRRRPSAISEPRRAPTNSSFIIGKRSAQPRVHTPWSLTRTFIRQRPSTSPLNPTASSFCICRVHNGGRRSRDLA